MRRAYGDISCPVIDVARRKNDLDNAIAFLPTLSLFLRRYQRSRIRDFFDCACAGKMAPRQQLTSVVFRDFSSFRATKWIRNAIKTRPVDASREIPRGKHISSPTWPFPGAEERDCHFDYDALGVKGAPRFSSARAADKKPRYAESRVKRSVGNASLSDRESHVYKTIYIDIPKKETDNCTHNEGATMPLSRPETRKHGSKRKHF